MARKVALTNARDVTTREGLSTYFQSPGVLWAYTGGVSYIYFALPFAPGATVLSAKLRLWSSKGMTNDATITLKRVEEPFVFERINWNFQPEVGAVIATDTGDPWEFDVTDQMNRICAGESWWGWQISSDLATVAGLEGSRTWNVSHRPVLEVTWSEPPQPPNDLQPRGGGVVSMAKPVLRFNFTDTEGADSMASYQVQIDPAANWAAPEFDLTQDSSLPQCDLADTAYVGLADGATTWWRVRVKDADGLWSDWSDPVSFTRLAKGVVTVTEPTGIFNDATPTVRWTFTGVQSRFQVSVRHVATGAWLFYSGYIAGAVQEYILPAGIITQDDAEYEFHVSVYDDEGRVPTPGDEGSATAFQTATWDRSDLVPVPDAVEVFTMEGWQDVRWTMADTTNISGFGIWRDGVLVSIAPKDNYRRGATDNFGFVDWYASPRMEHTWELMTYGVDGSSLHGPTFTKVVKYQTPWLSGVTDGSIAIPFVNVDIDSTLYEESSVVVPLAGNPVLVRSSVKGYLGSCTAELADNVGSRTAREYKEILLGLRENPEQCFFVWSDQSITCYVYNIQIAPRSSADGSTYYIISFSFLQTGGGQ